MTRLRTGAAVALTLVVVSGCTSTVTGVAVRDADSGPTDVQPLRPSELDDVLLSIDELNEISDATGMEISLAGEEMSDNSDAVSDPDCLGSIFSAEDQVYRRSGWTDVRDQVAREPDDDNAHWVEQTVVRFATEAQARDFVEKSTSAWQDCGGFSVAVDDGTTSSIWQIEDAVVDDELLTQVVSQEDSDGWECQHAMSAVTNVAVEAIACAFGISDEGATMVRALVANAAKR